MRDGTVLYLRPVLPGDNERTARGPVEFSDETALIAASNR